MRAPASAETSSPGALASFLDRCADLGCTQIDLADIYGHGRSETLVGEALSSASALREHFSLIAKAAVVFASGEGPRSAHHYRNDAAHLEASLTKTLKRLGCERVDLFLVHRPDYLLQFDELAGTLERMVASGRVGRVGVSNFPRDRLGQLQAAMSAPLVHHQIEFSVMETACLDEGLLDDAQSAKRELSEWSPLGGGRLFVTQNETARRVRGVLSEISGVSTDDAVAGAALAWIRHHPVAPTPILGGTSIERLTRQVTAMRAVRFDHESWYAVVEASRGQAVP